MKMFLINVHLSASNGGIRMKRQLESALLGMLLVSLAACVPMQRGRQEAAAIEVEKIPTPIASVSRADAFLDEGRLVVAGSLRRMHEIKFPGHVDIVLCGPEGLLERKVVTVPRLSSNRKGLMILPFTATFNLVPPPGAKVRIRYHKPLFADEEGLECAWPGRVP